MAGYADYSAGAGTDQSMPPAADEGADMTYMGSDTSAPAMSAEAGVDAGADSVADAGPSAMPVTEDTMGDTSPSPEEGAMPDVIKPLDASVASDQGSAPTYEAGADAADEGAQAGISAYDDAQEALMGPADDARMSVEEGMSDMTGIAGSAAAIGSMPDAGYGMEEEAVPAPAGDAGAEGAPGEAAGNEWAASALDMLSKAQEAAAAGNWAGFGESMNNLKSALQTAAGGAPMPLTPPQRIEPVAAAGAASAMSSLDSMGGASPSATDSGDTATNGAADYIAPAVVGAVALDAAHTSAGEAADMGGASMEAGAPSGPMAEAEPSGPPATVTPMASAAPQAAPGTSGARLILISTGAEMALPEQEEITVGREDPSSGIFPDVDLTPHGGEDGGVSRRHARLLHVGGDYFVEDLQSTNFTKLDGQRLPAHVRERLEDGARLDFGRVAMIFRRG
jgi:hypothetical protein